jgi:hypothetical protein
MQDSTNSFLAQPRFLRTALTSVTPVAQSGDITLRFMQVREPKPLPKDHRSDLSGQDLAKAKILCYETSVCTSMTFEGVMPNVRQHC